MSRQLINMVIAESNRVRALIGLYDDASPTEAAVAALMSVSVEKAEAAIATGNTLALEAALMDLGGYVS
jgi:molybdate-binding protein